MRKPSLVLIIMAIAAAMAIPANADLTPVGGPLDIGSWAQGFNETNVWSTAFDKMEIFMITPGLTFEGPGFSDFSIGGWNSSLVNPRYALAQGPSNANMTFNIRLTPDQSTPLTFDFLSWNGATLNDRARAVWNGGWAIADADTPLDAYDRMASVVPEPGSLLLAGMGLLGISAVLRKRA